MNNRIITIYGRKPFLVIAPHGGWKLGRSDTGDLRTDLISEKIAEEIGAFAVINKGWERSAKPNYRLYKADCNNIKHCSQQPLLTEFLAPIDYCKNIILSNYNKVYIFLIHGMDDTIRNYNGIDIIVGNGQGQPTRLSCTQAFGGRFISCLDLENFVPAQGKSGGRFSGWHQNNLNQMYVKDTAVESVQIEIASSLRQSNSDARKVAIRLGEAIERACDKTRQVPLMNIIPSY